MRLTIVCSITYLISPMNMSIFHNIHRFLQGLVSPFACVSCWMNSINLWFVLSSPLMLVEGTHFCTPMLVGITFQIVVACRARSYSWLLTSSWPKPPTSEWCVYLFPIHIPQIQKNTTRSKYVKIAHIFNGLVLEEDRMQKSKMSSQPKLMFFFVNV